MAETRTIAHQQECAYQGQEEEKTETEEAKAKRIKILDYSMSKLRFGLAQGLFLQLLSIVLVMTGYYTYIWRVSSDLAHYLQLQFPPSSAPFHKSFAFVTSPLYLQMMKDVFYTGITTSISILLLKPFSIYHQFVLEEQFGFNKMTARLYILDTLKGILLACVLGVPVLSGVSYVLNVSGPYLPLYLWLFLCCAQLIMLLIFPTVIQPLFNKMTPIAEGPLKIAIQHLSQNLSFPLTHIYIMDGSLRSSHSNAYFYGFFRHKHIVLFDTLLSQCTQDEILSIVAHELGHWSHSHTLLNLLFAQIQSALFFFSASYFLRCRQMYSDYGFVLPLDPTTKQYAFPLLIGLGLFFSLYSPIMTLLSYFIISVSRRFEYQADAFAVRLGFGKALIRALQVLQDQNLGYDDPDPWYSAFHHTHPPVPHRQRAIEALLKKSL
jgi:STE24 endopeptidase